VNNKKIKRRKTMEIITALVTIIFLMGLIISALLLHGK
jgi:uncharacterized membrane protein affecting hemolysin expression